MAVSKSSVGMLFILEGPDGVGKSTIVRRLVEQIQEAGRSCIGLAFPGNLTGTLGQHVYKLHHALDAYNIADIAPMSLQVMHVAAHIDTIDRVIRPAISSGEVVILDRYWWSTWVYGAHADLGLEQLDKLIEFERSVWGDLLPRAIFLVDRQSLANGTSESERSSLSVLYNRLAERESSESRVVRVNNDGPVSSAVSEILQEVIGREL